MSAAKQVSIMTTQMLRPRWTLTKFSKRLKVAFRLPGKKSLWCSLSCRWYVKLDCLVPYEALFFCLCLSLSSGKVEVQFYRKEPLFLISCAVSWLPLFFCIAFSINFAHLLMLPLLWKQSITCLCQWLACNLVNLPRNCRWYDHLYSLLRESKSIHKENGSQGHIHALQWPSSVSKSYQPRPQHCIQ